MRKKCKGILVHGFQLSEKALRPIRTERDG